MVIKRVAACCALVVLAWTAAPGTLHASRVFAAPAHRCACTGGSCPLTSGRRARSAFSKPAAAGHAAASPPATVPGNDRAVIFSIFPQDNARSGDQPGQIDRLTTILTGEHYKVTLDSTTGAAPGSATAQSFVKAAGAGIFIFSTHGGYSPNLPENDPSNGFVVEEFFNEAAFNKAWAADHKDPAVGGASFGTFFSSDHFVDGDNGKREAWTITITPMGIRHFFSGHETHSLVIGAACYSAHFAADFGAREYFGYTEPSTDSQCWSDWDLLLGRMSGTIGYVDARTASAAYLRGDFTNVRNGPFFADLPTPDNANMTLSPAVDGIRWPSGPPPKGQVFGAFTIHFDTAMNRSVSAASVVSSSVATVLSPTWTASNELTFHLKTKPHACDLQCDLPVTLSAKNATAAGSFPGELDGNTNPPGDLAGTSPNGDDERMTVQILPPGYEATPITQAATSSVVITGLNKNGVVIGDAVFPTSATADGNGFTWTADRGFAILPDVGSSSPVVTAALGINDEGDVAGWTTFGTEFGDVCCASPEATVWKAGGGGRLLGFLASVPGSGGPNYYSQSEAIGINARGDVTGWSALGELGPYHAFFEGAGQTQMKDIASSSESKSDLVRGLAVNANGDILVHFTRSTSKGETLSSELLTGGAAVPIALRASEYPYPAGQPLNDSGDVAGTTRNPACGIQFTCLKGQAAWSDKTGKISTLTPLPGFTNGSAYGIDDAGDIVGSSNLPSENEAVATLWASATSASPAKPQNLNPLVVPRLGFTLHSAVFVNAKGQIVATGNGEYVFLDPGGRRLRVQS